MEDRLASRPFVLASLANFAQALSFNLFLHFPGYLQELGADEPTIGWIQGAGFVAAVAIRPFLARVLDRRGRRGVILAGQATNALACALYLTVHELGPWVFTVRIVHGFAEAMLFTALFTYAADHVPPSRRNQGLALFGASSMFPIALGGVVGDLVLAGGSYRALFRLSLVLAGVALLLSLPLRDRPRFADGAPASRGLRAALWQPDLLPLWFMTLVFSSGLTAFFVFLKTFVLETGIGSVGLFFSAYTGAALAVRIFAGWLPDRLGPRAVLHPALASFVAGFFLLAAAKGGTEVVLAGLACGIGHGYTFPILFSLVVTRAREEERGSAMAIFTALFDVGGLLGSPSLGALIGRAGYAATFAATGVLVALGAIVFARLDRGNRVG